MIPPAEWNAVENQSSAVDQSFEHGLYLRGFLEELDELNYAEEMTRMLCLPSASFDRAMLTVSF
jgi:hypothetical protein